MPSSRAASASAPGPMKAAASTPPASASSTPAASAASIPGSMAATLSPPLGKGHPCPASPPRPPPEDRGCERLRAGQAGKLAGQLARVDLVVLDELGYLPFAQSGGQLLFHLLS